MRPTDANIKEGDLRVLLPILKNLNPKIVVEIGTYFGGSAKLWRKELNPEILITMDIKRWANVDNCHYLIGNSQDVETFDKVVNILDNKQIDFLFIDGGHLYDEVKGDFESFSSLVTDGGLIVFHDILYRNKENDVPTFWKEIKRHYNYIEIAQDHDTTGIGIITKQKAFERTEHGNIT